MFYSFPGVIRAARTVRLLHPPPFAGTGRQKTYDAMRFRAKIAIFDDKIATVSPMNIENFLQQQAADTIAALYGPADPAAAQIQKTRKEFEGDYTLVVFPLLKLSRKKPEETATEIGEALVKNVPEIKGYNVIKGFLNLSLSNAFWGERLAEVVADADFGKGLPHRQNGDGRIFVAQHQQAAAPGPHPQQPARILGRADTLRSGQQSDQGEPRQRPRHPHLQVDAGLAAVR